MLTRLKMSKSLKPRQFQLMDVTGGHPNKIPFKCALFEIDKPSDGSPEGAGGKKIRISSVVCDQYLQTFVGMAFNIDYHNEMRGHDTRFKVGVMEKVYRSMDGFAMVEGYIYGKDFPDVVATIRYYNGLADEYGWEEYRFGASLEMEASVKNAEDDTNILDVVEFCGTGGAILYAESAAFTNTSFAAKNSKKEEVVNKMTPEEIKAMQDALKAVTDGMTTLSASVQTVVTEVGAIKTEVESIKASKEADEKKNAEEAATAELKAAQDKAAALEKELADLKAAAKGGEGGKDEEPQRKTASPAQLLAKYGKVEESATTDYKSFCASVDQLNLSSAESLKLKIAAKAQFQKDGE
ncbi:3-oxoacyl-ACP reductase [Paenibacillus thermotolerans]|uniref:3-oxoacyl-ACP reductase n=1 Tax=Paenibacillus thermotolerans TaxID=3027807 RepID=UPI002367BDE5|nr:MULTISPECIES: 3-oxoacyl-ACP reductase [unclassified Paenibacillus]